MNEREMEQAMASLREKRLKRVAESKITPNEMLEERVIRAWEAHGLTCIIAKGPVSINGYVAIPESHPWHRIDYAECLESCGKDFCGHSPEYKIQVHGGITYSGLRPNGEWVFGFDTAHAGDYVDYGVPGISPDTDGRRWDEKGVAQETERLAEQLAAAVDQGTEAERG